MDRTSYVRWIAWVGLRICGDGPDGDGAVCVETDAHRAREPWAMSVVPR